MSDPARFQTYLGLIAAETRGDLPLSGIAHDAGISDTGTLRRFENGETYPQNADRVMAAYAKHAGLADARELFLAAAQRWKDDGRPPTSAGGDDNGEEGAFSSAAAAGRALRGEPRHPRRAASKPGPKRSPRA